jgi:hypothetical protein
MNYKSECCQKISLLLNYAKSWILSVAAGQHPIVEALVLIVLILVEEKCGRWRVRMPVVFVISDIVR